MLNAQHLKAKWISKMLWLFLLPGDLVCDWSGITPDSDHRQVLRSFINTIVWGAVASGVTILVMS